jgi:hypothetical protein
MSSIDRIDETKGYSIDNIQLISHHENIEKRIGAKCEFLSKKRKLQASKKNKKAYDDSMENKGNPKIAPY